MTQPKQIAALLRKPVTGRALHHVAGGAKPSAVPTAVAPQGNQPRLGIPGEGRGTSS